MTHLSPKGIIALTKVAQWLEAGAPHVQVADNIEVGHFNMEYAVVANPGSGDDCGTACCIAGAVCQFEMLGLNERSKDGDLEWMPEGLFSNEIKKDSSVKGAFYLAADYLGMGYDAARHLFEPFNIEVEFLEQDEYNDPEIAARVVRNFIETGVVDWNQACEENYLIKNN